MGFSWTLGMGDLTDPKNFHWNFLEVVIISAMDLRSLLLDHSLSPTDHPRSWFFFGPGEKIMFSWLKGWIIASKWAEREIRITFREKVVWSLQNLYVCMRNRLLDVS